MIGADIVMIDRVAKAVESERFKKRVFTEREIAYAEQKAKKAHTYAGIFAVKEAVAKLMGRGICGFSLIDIEVEHDEWGAPSIVLHGGARRTDKAVYVSISHDGNYAFAVASFDASEFVPTLPGKTITDGDLALNKRLRDTHKGDYGRVYVIGGSPNMIGAPFISAQAAVKAGAGLTTLCVANSLAYAYRPRVTEIMLKGMPDQGGMIDFDEKALSEIAKSANAIVIGMGMGKNERLIDIIRYLFEAFDGALVCDADAINCLSAHPDALFTARKCTLVLTPHVGEWNRLVDALGSRGLTINDVCELAASIGAVVARKSAYTTISDGITDYNVTSGSAAIAKGGSGDALSGIIGAYLCRMIPIEGVALACHTFGRCGEKAEKLLGENAVTATDIINCL